MREPERQSIAGMEAFGILHVEVKMWFTAVAGIAATCHLLAPQHVLAFADTDTAFFQMGKDRIPILTMLDHQMIPCNMLCLAKIPAFSKNKAIIVGVHYFDHHPVSRTENRFPIAVVALHAPFISLERGACFVHLHYIIGIPLDRNIP